MTNEEFRKYAHEVVDWMADYLENVEDYPVLPDVAPGDILNSIEKKIPTEGESFGDIFQDFKKLILPGMTHWESPNFMAYFPANKSHASILGEMLMSTMGAQCMIWLTSPAATELEEHVMKWLADILGISADYPGVIQDTASTATLCAILTAREKKTSFKINEEGFKSQKFTIYSSSQVHSSIDKAVKIAGIGEQNIRKIKVDESFALIPADLERQINADIEAGFTPLCVISALGTTSTTAIDPIEEIDIICKKHSIWHHVDAAYAGIALALPELRWMSKGINEADSIVVNPHKWMFTNFDCTAYFVKDPVALTNTFSITPDYLKTSMDNQVKNFRDWGIPLGRRFRALKLWFVIREFGLKGIREKLRKHIEYGKWLSKQINEDSEFELLAPVPLNTVCFRYINTNTDLDEFNKSIMDQVNKTGKLFFTQTQLNDVFALRLAFGNTNLEHKHVENAWSLIKKTAHQIKHEG